MSDGVRLPARDATYCNPPRGQWSPGDSFPGSCAGLAPPFSVERDKRALVGPVSLSLAHRAQFETVLAWHAFCKVCRSGSLDLRP